MNYQLHQVNYLDVSNELLDILNELLDVLYLEN